MLVIIEAPTVELRAGHGASHEETSETLHAVLVI